MNPRRMEENGAYSSASRSSCSGDRTGQKWAAEKRSRPPQRTRSGTASPAASAPRPPRRPPAPCPPGRTPENTALETAAPQPRPQSTRGRWQGSRAVLPRHIQSTCFSCSSSFTFRSAAGFGRALYGRYYSTSRRRRKYPRHADECKIFVDSQAMLHASVENPLQSRYNEKHKSCDEKETGLRCFNRRERHN